MITKEYEERVEQIKDAHEGAILRILEGMRKALVEAGFDACEPYEMSDSTYQWWMSVYLAGSDSEQHEDDIDIIFEISESLAYQGTLEGVNFSISVTTVGGEIIGGLTPYNYTEEVWVDVKDADGIRERFRIFEEADPASIVELIQDHVASEVKDD